jgi:hypothetical protein
MGDAQNLCFIGRMCHLAYFIVLSKEVLVKIGIWDVH